MNDLLALVPDSLLKYAAYVVFFSSIAARVVEFIAPRTENKIDDRVKDAMNWLKVNVFDRLAMNSKALEAPKDIEAPKDSEPNA
jgi:hypothetical protein